MMYSRKAIPSPLREGVRGWGKLPHFTQSAASPTPQPRPSMRGGAKYKNQTGHYWSGMTKRGGFWLFVYIRKQVNPDTTFVLRHFYRLARRYWSGQGNSTRSALAAWRGQYGSRSIFLARNTASAWPVATICSAWAGSVM